MDIKPTIFVLFGASGHLARTRILPALYDLWFENALPVKFRLFVVGRHDLDLNQFWQGLATHPESPFTKRLDILTPEYIKVDFDNQDGFTPLWDKLRHYKDYQIVYYSALPPTILNKCADRFLDESSMSKMLGREALIVTEKPFGDSLIDAEALNKKLAKVFTHKFIYRNDHYLRKDTVQTIYNLVEDDVHLAHILNSSSLEEIELIVSEASDLGSRASYFEGRGMIVDWFQSHMLQLVANLCSDKNLDPAHAKQEFIESLEPVAESLLLARYDTYTDLPDVPQDSTTETFMAVQMISNLPNWQGVIFKFIAGKAMSRKEVYFRLRFRKPHYKYGEYVDLLIDPPSGSPIIRPTYPDEFEETIINALNHKEKDFVTTPEIKAQWLTTQKVIDMKSTVPIQTYQKGTDYRDFCDINNLWCRDND